MDERAAPETLRRWTRLDWRLVALLAVLAAGMRLWQLGHTEVAARDSIGFIRHAWQFHQTPLLHWPEVLQHSEQHPLYPLWVLAVSQLIEPFHPGPASLLFQYSAQIASALAAVLLVLPLYALGRELFDRRVGFFTALMLQCLPVSGRILADGLSEATFLFLAASALYFGVRALGKRGTRSAFVLTGLFSGLAYLTRPEGALVAAATGVMLLVGQAVQRWRLGWSEVFIRGGLLTAAALLLAAPLIALTGKLTLKPSIIRVGHDLVEMPRPVPISGILLALWDHPDEKAATERFWWGFWALGSGLVKGTFYVGWAAVLLGLWCQGRRGLNQPGVWMMMLVCLGVAYGTWRVAVVVGYLSDRHTLLILLCGMPWAMAGVIAAGEWLAQRDRRYARAPLLLPLCCVLAGLPKVLEPLHAHRAGFREVGQWLAAHTHPVDAINDPLCWAHYYAGRVFLEHTEHPIPPGYRASEFIVLEKAGNEHARVRAYQEAVRRAEKGKLVQSWSIRRGKKPVVLEVYAVPLGT